MAKNKVPFRLDEGIWLEDIDYIIPWGTSISSLKETLSPSLNWQTESIHITWENHTCFHIPCDISTCQLFGELNPRAYRIFLDTFHFASCQIRGINTYHPENSANEFKQIYSYLWGQLGEPTGSYPKYFENLPGIFWEYEKVIISYSASGRTSFSIDVQHEPDGYDDIKNEARKIRLREGDGARVDHVAW